MWFHSIFRFSCVFPFCLVVCGKATCKGYASAGKLIAIIFLRPCTRSKARSALSLLAPWKVEIFAAVFLFSFHESFSWAHKQHYTKTLKCLGLDLMVIAFCFSSCHVVDFFSRFFCHKLATSTASVVQLRHFTASFFDPTRPLSLFMGDSNGGTESVACCCGILRGWFRNIYRRHLM